MINLKKEGYEDCGSSTGNPEIWKARSAHFGHGEFFAVKEKNGRVEIIGALADGPHEFVPEPRNHGELDRGIPGEEAIFFIFLGRQRIG
jgi:hypothetical protein